jgi:hypothetical protein
MPELQKTRSAATGGTLLIGELQIRHKAQMICSVRSLKYTTSSSRVRNGPRLPRPGWVLAIGLAAFITTCIFCDFVSHSLHDMYLLRATSSGRSDAEVRYIFWVVRRSSVDVGQVKYYDTPSTLIMVACSTDYVVAAVTKCRTAHSGTCTNPLDMGGGD